MRSGSVGALPRPGQTWAGWRRAAGTLWGVLQHDRFAFAGIVIYALFVLIALSAPLLTPYDPQQTIISGDQLMANRPPSRAYPLGTTNVVRAQVLTLRERGFVEAARVLGSSPRRLMLVHLAPNVLPIALLYGSLAVGWAILTEASVSFLGFGDPARISWGYMLQDAYISQ